MQTDIDQTSNTPEELPPCPLNLDGLPLEYWELLDAKEAEIRTLSRKLTIAENKIAQLQGLDVPWPDWRKKAA